MVDHTFWLGFVALLLPSSACQATSLGSVTKISLPLLRVMLHNSAGVRFRVRRRLVLNDSLVVVLGCSRGIFDLPSRLTLNKLLLGGSLDWNRGRSLLLRRRCLCLCVLRLGLVVVAIGLLVRDDGPSLRSELLRALGRLMSTFGGLSRELSPALVRIGPLAFVGRVIFARGWCRGGAIQTLGWPALTLVR